MNVVVVVRLDLQNFPVLSEASMNLKGKIAHWGIGP